MAITLGEAIVWLRAQDKDFDKGLDEAEKKSRGWAGKVGAIVGGGLKIAAGVGLAAVTGLAASLTVALKSAAEEQVGVEQLAASVRASGADWDTAQGAIESYLVAEAKRIALDDGAGRESLSLLTQTTKDYTKALELMPLAADWARGKNVDLATAAGLIGKVYEGNTGILSRYGIELDKNATAEEALAAMQAQVAGQAESYAGTYEGAQAKMSIAVGNLKEMVGGYLIGPASEFMTHLATLAMDALPKVEAFIKDPLIPTLKEMYRWFNENIVPKLETLGLWLQTNIPKALTFLGGAWNTFKTSYLEPAAVAVGVVIDAFKILWGWIDRALKLLQEWNDKWNRTSAPYAGPVVTPETPPPEGVVVPGMQSGGTFVTRRPTWFMAGEGQEPEQVTVTPLGHRRQRTNPAPVVFNYHDYTGENAAKAIAMARTFTDALEMRLY